MAGIDENTKLMMHMNGADNGVVFGDDSPSAHGNADVTADVNTKTGEKKWGTASALFDGDSGYLAYVDSADWDICGSNSDDWTIDLQVKHGTSSFTGIYLSQSLDDNNRWQFQHDTGSGLRFSLKSTDWLIIMPYGGDITDTDWHHIALCKVASLYGLYLDGIQVSYLSDDSIATFAADLEIGRLSAFGGISYFNGYMDELRIQHSNVFEATPNATPDDTIVVPTSEYSSITARSQASRIIMIQ